MADGTRGTAGTEETASELGAIRRRLERQHDVLRSRKPVDGRETPEPIDAGDVVEMNPLTQDRQDA